MKFILIGWIIGDLVCNASGFGFNGYDVDGKPKWNLLTNFNFLSVEVVYIYDMYASYFVSGEKYL
jgi:hypothetical protein